MKEKSSLKLPAQLRLIEKATDVAAEGIVITDASLPHNPIIYVNEGFVRITGFSRGKNLVQNCRFLPGEATNPQTIDQVRQAVHEQRELIVELSEYTFVGKFRGINRAKK